MGLLLPEVPEECEFGACSSWPGDPNNFMSMPNAKTQWEMLKKGFYWNPLDQFINDYFTKLHSGWTFRQIAGTVCSTHVIVNPTTGQEDPNQTHKDAVNPVPLVTWVPPFSSAAWTSTIAGHTIFDVGHVYAGRRIEDSQVGAATFDQRSGRGPQD
jgi:hypothetical protein